MGCVGRRLQEGSRDLRKGYPSVTKGASSLAKHPSKVPFTKAWRGLHLLKAFKGASKDLKGAWREAARSTFLLCLRVNRWCSLRKLMLGPLLPLPGLKHFVSSWVHLTWKAFWEQLLWWVHLCMELGMSGLAMPTSIFMIMNSLVLLQPSGPHFPPPAIVEALQDYVTNYHKVRRLHLIVVDLWRPWKYNTARARQITDQLWRISDCDDTRRVSPFRPEGPALHYGAVDLLMDALDGSECPDKTHITTMGLQQTSVHGRTT